ncbi:hypothetical protein Scep_025851 [Stephania cephalantha]|uniref:Uncharacterized protein n=1 Tax=Stephania cephalantha TaxID=152367 RepID=A0AAP0EP91_9MAGN
MKKSSLCMYIVIKKKKASAITLKGVEEDEYWSDPKDEVKISPLEPEVITVEVHEKEVKKKIEFALERPEELEEESKENQPLVLVKPPTLPRILVEFEMGVEEKGNLEILYADDTFVLDGHDKIKPFLIKDQDELETIKRVVHITLPMIAGRLFVRNFSKLVGVT